MYYMQTSKDINDASLLLCRSIGDATDKREVLVEQHRSSLEKNPTFVIHISELVPVTLRVRLESCGNPDYRQNPEQPITGVVGGFVDVDTFEEAQSICGAFINNNELGSGNWAGGQIYADDHAVAYVSYNGRLWTGETEGFENKFI